MDPANLLQLADDTMIVAETDISLRLKFNCILNYSRQKYLEINYDKTKYMQMSDNPSLTDIVINEDISIGAVKPSTGYTWLGFVLSYTSNIYNLVEFNLNKKKFNVAKFYSWLQLNESTPFF